MLGDDYRYSAGSFHQRNRLFRNVGEVAWMTVPMQKKFSTGLPLNEAQIAEEPPWRQPMWKQIRNTYRSTPFFGRVAAEVEAWLLTPAPSLADQNIGFIRLACELMGLQREFRRSSQRPAELTRSQRVVDLLQWCEARFYLCARGSFGYMKNDGVFPVKGIEVLFQDFQPPAYPQAVARGSLCRISRSSTPCSTSGRRRLASSIDTHAKTWQTWDEMAASGGPCGVAELEPCQESA